MDDDVDPRLDLRYGTTSNLLTETARRIGAAEALVDGDLRLTYAELDAAVTHAAAAFLAQGIDKGDRIAIWAPNSAPWVIAALGLQRAGAVLVPINTRFLGGEAAYVLRKSRARLLFTTTDFLGRDYPAEVAAENDTPDLRLVVTLSGEPSAGALPWADFVARGAGVDPAAVAERAASLDADDVADILFTSGTTGRPKGAVCTHGQNLRAYTVWGNVVGLREGDRYLIVNPFFHGFGYRAGWLVSIIFGATIIPARTLDVPTIIATVRDENVTVLPGTPTLYQTMLEHPDFTKEGVESLRLAVTGAANVPPALLQRIKDEMGFEHIVTGYGLTETTGIITMCRYDDPLEVVRTSAGRALPGLELRVVAPDGTPLPPDTEGEIVVRGYVVMLGYLDEPEETAETIDADGWLHTGDIGKLTADGLISITDRIKDMYIVGGFNAYPAEIENILSKHPAIAQAAVIGVPDERMGEVGAAFVIPRAGQSISVEDVIAYSRANMANYKVPRQVRIVDSLPLNASGKVLKNDLRALVAR